MIYTCPFCNWTGREPQMSEFDNCEDYRAAIVAFRDDQDNHDCSTY